MAGRYVPITAWLPHYPRTWLGKRHRRRCDHLGRDGARVAMAYAELAGVPAGIGLVTATAGSPRTRILGTSRHVKVTTSSTMAVMSASVVAPAAGGDSGHLPGPDGDAGHHGRRHAARGRLLKLGFLSEFLAKPVITGFIVGLGHHASPSVSCRRLLGVPGSSGNVFEQLTDSSDQLPQDQRRRPGHGTRGHGLSSSCRRRIDRRIPGPLIAVVGAIVMTTALGLAAGRPRGRRRPLRWPAHAVAAAGRPGRPGLPGHRRGRHRLPGAGRIDRRLASVRQPPWLPHRPRPGAGRAWWLRTSRVACSAASRSMPASARWRPVRPPATRASWPSLVTAAGLLLTMLVLAPLFTNLPQAILAAIIITSVISLVDLAEWKRYIQWRRTDAALASIAAVGRHLHRASSSVSSSRRSYRWSSCSSVPASRPWPSWGGCPGPRLVSSMSSAIDDASPIEELADHAARYAALLLQRDRGLRPGLAAVDAADQPPSAVLLDIEATIELDVTTSDALYGLIGALEERGSRLVDRARQGSRARPHAEGRPQRTAWSQRHVPHRADRRRSAHGAGRRRNGALLVDSHDGYWDIEAIRSRFPSLGRMGYGARPVAWLDGPAGTQVVDACIRNIAAHLSYAQLEPRRCVRRERRDGRVVARRARMPWPICWVRRSPPRSASGRA